MTATVRQCVVRVNNPQTVRGRPVLWWTLRELSRFGVTECLLLTESMPNGITTDLPRPVRVSLAPPLTGTGLGGALSQARDQLHDRFLLCDGDTLFDCNLANLLSDAATDDPSVVGRLAPGLNGGGIALFRKALLDHRQPAGSFDAWPDLVARGLLRKTTANGRFAYVGQSQLRIPPPPWLDDPPASWRSSARSPAIPQDAGDPTANDPIARLRRRSLFLDRDGVLNIDHGYIGSRDRFEWVDGALDAIRYATEAGWHVFVVTNQSGVARGLYTEHDVEALLGWIADQARGAGGTIDDARFCPFHPEAALDAYRRTHPWRKPSPGMLLDLIRTWELDPRRAVMVGDQPTDLQAAAAAGVMGHQFPGGNLLTFVRPILQSLR